jgi:hypothetical protein
LGLELPDGYAFGEARIERQADAISEKWFERYRSES